MEREHHVAKTMGSLPSKEELVRTVVKARGARTELSWWN